MNFVMTITKENVIRIEYSFRRAEINYVKIIHSQVSIAHVLLKIYDFTVSEIKDQNRYK